MALKTEMSWDGPRGRWVKMYKGGRYTVACSVLGAPSTKEGSATAANAWWRRKRAEIDARPLTDPLASQALRLRREILEAADLEGETTDFVSRIKGEVKALEGGSGVNVGDSPLLDPLAVLPIPERMKWMERTDQLAAHKRWTGKEAVSQDKTIGVQVDEFLASLKAREAVKEISAGQYDNLRMCLVKLTEYFGSLNSVDSITESSLDKYVNHLLGLVGERLRDPSQGISRDYAAKCLATAKRFIRFLWERRLVELPRNLDRVEIQKSAKVIETIEPEMVRMLIDEAPGQLKLHLLLMANCGFGQTDVSDLLDSEVDWTNGRIRRKRSKTSDHEDVPIVDYELWKPTFELLKQYRSGQPNCLLTISGQPWVFEEIVDGKLRSKDSIASNYTHLKKKLARRGIDAPPMKLLRKTGATLIESHPTLGRYASHYLGHSPRSVADRHYSAPSRENFDELLNWLGQKLGIIS